MKEFKVGKQTKMGDVTCPSCGKIDLGIQDEVFTKESGTPEWKKCKPYFECDYCDAQFEAIEVKGE